MDSRRFFKLIARRWWLVAILAVAGAATAFLVTRSQNSDIEETFQATAPVLVLQTSSESDDLYEARLRTLEGRARLDLTNQLLVPGTDIQARVALDRLNFIATGPSEADAILRAETLRAAYEVAEPAGDIVRELNDQLAASESEIIGLRAERAALTAGTPIDPGVAAELALMEAQLSSLRQSAAALSLGVLVSELGTAPDELGNPRPVEEVQQELNDVRIVISRVEREYEQLRASNPTAEALDPGEDLDLLVLDQKLRDAEARYISTSLTIEELIGGGSGLFADNTTVVNVTSVPTSPERAGLIGLLLGAALAAGIIMLKDRLRRPVLGIEENMPFALLASVDPVRPGASDNTAWYPSANDARRSDVQALRAALDGVMTNGSVSIAFSSVGASNEAVQELAADVATAVAATDRKVLLLDAMFDAPSELPEFGSKVTTLADIVTLNPSAEDGRAELKLLLGDRDEVLPELIAMRAGELSGDPADAVAGRRFRELLDVAREMVEVIIVASPEWSDPATDVLTQRLDHVVFVGRLGTTPAVELDYAAAEMSSRNASALGCVLLRRRKYGLWRRRRHARASRRQAALGDTKAAGAAAGLDRGFDDFAEDEISAPDYAPEPDPVGATPPIVAHTAIGEAIDSDQPELASTDARRDFEMEQTAQEQTAQEQTAQEQTAQEQVEQEQTATRTQRASSEPTPPELGDEAIERGDLDPTVAGSDTTAELDEEASEPYEEASEVDRLVSNQVENDAAGEDHPATAAESLPSVPLTPEVLPAQNAFSGPIEIHAEPTIDVADEDVPVRQTNETANRKMPPAAFVPPPPPGSAPAVITSSDELDAAGAGKSAEVPDDEPPLDVSEAAAPDDLVSDLDADSELAARGGTAAAVAAVTAPSSRSIAHEAQSQPDLDDDVADDTTGRRRLSKVGAWVRRSAVEDADSDETKAGTTAATEIDSGDGIEAGESFLLDEVADLLRHGIDRPTLYGHPSGALLLYPNRITEPAAAILYNAVFKDAPARSEALEDSIARVLSDGSSQPSPQHVADNIDWWYRTVGVEPDNSRREQLVAGLDAWMRNRLVAAQASRHGDPTIWFLSSSLGTFQALVRTDSFDIKRVITLRSGSVRRLLERLRILLWRESEDTPAEAETIRQAIADVEELDEALHRLGSGAPGVPFTRSEIETVGILRSEARSDA